MGIIRSGLLVPSDIDMTCMTGAADEILHVVESLFDAQVTVRGSRLEFEGDEAEVRTLEALFGELIARVSAGELLTPDLVEHTVLLLREGAFAPAALRDDVLLTHRGRALRPKTAGQKRYVDAIRHNTITFGIGPAGTGKTYLAMAMAVAALRREEVRRIVLTRPVVEAGENLGFLPGTLEEKIDPYMRPLHDAVFDMLDREYAMGLIEKGIIEVAPLAFMRGRTLNDAFVILDEAQNTTRAQMRMFLTRLGSGSKFVVTADMTQTDLEENASSFPEICSILQGVDDIAFAELGTADVVRHRLVAKIVAAYDRASRHV